MSPTRKSLRKTPSLSTMSFARCFGASAPLSPRARNGHGLLLGDQQAAAGVSYIKLGFNEEDDGEDEEEGKEELESSKDSKDVKSKGGLKTSCINLGTLSPARVHVISSPSSPSPSSPLPGSRAVKTGGFGAKVREAFARVLETAHRSSPHLSELFVGNQLLMQVTSSSTSVRARRAKHVIPSAGFHNVSVAHDLTSSLSNTNNSPSNNFLSPAYGY